MTASNQSSAPYSPKASGAPSAATIGTPKAAAEITTALGGTRWLYGSATVGILPRGGWVRTVRARGLLY